MSNYRDITTLRNWDKNPRSSTDENIERLIKQIKKLGVYKPLLITEDGTVLGGNMRLKALQKMGEKKVWVSVVQADTEEKKIEYALSDNDRVGKYEGDQLANLIGNFPDVEWGDYSVDIKPPELITDLMDSFKEVEEDEAPEVSSEPAVSQLGEVYQLGRHRVMCGDSTKIEDVEKLMDGKKADMVFTDPPYGMFLDADFSDMKNDMTFASLKGLKNGRKYDNVKGDHEDFNPEFINVIFSQFGYSKEIFLWGANYYSELLLDRNDGSWIVWDKRLEDSADKMYGSCFELCWSKNKHKQDIARVKWAGVFGTEKEFDHKRHHPTQKPIGLSTWFIDRYSEKNQLIVDLFLGSGSTLIACEQTNRTCYGMELDPKYVDVIRKRYAKFINKEAEWETVTPVINR